MAPGQLRPPLFNQKRVLINSNYAPNQDYLLTKKHQHGQILTKSKKVMAYLQCLGFEKGFNPFGKRHHPKDGLQILKRWLWKWTLIKIKDYIEMKFSRKVQIFRNCKLGNDLCLLQGGTHIVSIKFSIEV